MSSKISVYIISKVLFLLATLTPEIAYSKVREELPINSESYFSIYTLYFCDFPNSYSVIQFLLFLWPISQVHILGEGMKKSGKKPCGDWEANI